MFAKKGSKKHISSGKLFTTAMYIVALSGLIMSTIVLIDPIGIKFPNRDLSLNQGLAAAESVRTFAMFLFMLSVLVFTVVRQSILVLKAKADRTVLKSFSNISLIAFLALTAVIVGYIAIVKDVLLLKIFAVICLLNSIESYYYIFKNTLRTNEWIIAHLRHIVGAGIAAHTAFFVFGGSRLLNHILQGDSRVILWVAPGIIGTIFTVWYSKKKKKQLKLV